jgi:hypothetical protein
VRGDVVDCKNFPGSDVSKRARRLREAMGFNGRGAQQAFANFLGVDRGRWNNVECGAPLSKVPYGGADRGDGACALRAIEGK